MLSLAISSYLHLLNLKWVWLFFRYWWPNFLVKLLFWLILKNKLISYSQRSRNGVGLIIYIISYIVRGWSQFDSFEYGDRRLAKRFFKACTNSPKLLFLGLHINSFEQHPVTTWHFNHVIFSWSQSKCSRILFKWNQTFLLSIVLSSSHNRALSLW